MKNKPLCMPAYIYNDKGQPIAYKINVVGENQVIAFVSYDGLDFDLEVDHTNGDLSWFERMERASQSLGFASSFEMLATIGDDLFKSVRPGQLQPQGESR